MRIYRNAGEYLRLIPGLFLFLLFFVPPFLAAQELVEVRYGRTLIESFDGVGFSYFEARELSVPPPTVSSIYSRSYPADFLVDGDPTTAWIEGASGYGVGETILFEVNEVPRIIEMWPGYQKSDALHQRNGRPAQFRLSFLGYNPETGAPGYRILTYEVDLIRNYEANVPRLPQYIHLSNKEMLHNMELTELYGLEIEILLVDHDDGDPDTAISEVKLYAEGDLVGTRSVGYQE